MFFKDVNYQKINLVPKKKVDEHILMCVDNKPGITNEELALELGRSVRTVKRYLKKLIEGDILTSQLSYNSYIQGGELKILTVRKLKRCNIKKSSQ